MADKPSARRKGVHPLWARVLVGLIGGTLLGGLVIMQSGDALGSPLSIGFALLLMYIAVHAMVRAKKIWSVFEIFHGL
jgi:predicted lipid-binding transport protein (Tim44 family)